MIFLDNYNCVAILSSGYCAKNINRIGKNRGHELAAYVCNSVQFSLI